MPPLARSAAAAGLASALVRATGLVREVAFAAAFGAGLETDAWMAAFRIPNLLRDLFAEGSMANAFVPGFARELEEGGEASAWALANAVLGVVLAGLGVVTLALVLLARPAVWLVAAGFSDVPGKVELTAELVRAVAPFLAGLSLASLFGGMLNVRGRFFVPQLAPAAMNVAVIAASLAPTRLADALGVRPIVLVAVAATAGGVLGAVMQVPSLWAEGFRFRPTLGRHPAVRRVLAFLAPALVGLATIQVGVVVDLQIASSFGDGPVSWLAYAFRLVQLPMSLFAGAVAVAGLAVLSSEVARGEREKARHTLTDAIALTSWLVVPCAVALAVFPEPIVRLVFERGHFGPADTIATAALLRWYAIGTLAFSLHRVVVPALYAWGDAWTPMGLSIATVVLKVPLALWWSRPGAMGVAGIPLAHAAVASAEVVVLCGVLVRRAGGLPRRALTEHARIAVAAAAMGAVAWPLASRVDGGVATLGALAATSVVYVGASVALGLPQPRAVLGLVAPKGLPPHVDPETVAALVTHAGAALGDVVPTDGAVVVTTAKGVLRLTARSGVLVATTAPAEAAASGAPVRIAGVLDVASRPPPLHGVVLESGAARWSFVARGDAVIAANPVGPVVEVA